MTVGGVFIVRREDGEYFQGCGYGGPGNPVPYWSDEIRTAKSYRTPEGARNAAKRFGGYIGIAEADSDGVPVRWIGFAVWQLGRYRPVDVNPKDFDPNDYEGNNAPLAVSLQGKSDNADGSEDTLPE